MFFKPRYIHFQPTNNQWRKYNGFSVFLAPSDYPDTVDFKYTLCSRHDQFNKKKARAFLETQPFLTCTVRNLPATLTALELKVEGIGRSFDSHMSNKWTWVWKYFL